MISGIGIIIILNLRLRYLNLPLQISDPILQDRNATIPSSASQSLSQSLEICNIPNSLITSLRRIRASDITRPPFSLTVPARIATVAFDPQAATPITRPGDLLSFR